MQKSQYFTHEKILSFVLSKSVHAAQLNKHFLCEYNKNSRFQGSLHNCKGFREQWIENWKALQNHRPCCKA